jgi:hypothetical protein
VITDVLFEASVDRDGNFPENEGVGVDITECLALFLLDGFLEDANRLCPCNFDRKDVVMFIAENDTVELEVSMSIFCLKKRARTGCY